MSCQSCDTTHFIENQVVLEKLSLMKKLSVKSVIPYSMLKKPQKVTDLEINYSNVWENL